MSLIYGENSGVFFDGEIPGPHGFLWGFVALEYYAFIWNRVRLVLVTSQSLVAINAGGPIATPRSLTDAWYEPFSYVSDRKVRPYANLAAESDDLLEVSHSNWKCKLPEISSTSFKTSSKWGMGSVPYSGRLFVTVNTLEYEFILIGNQNGKEIQDALQSGKAPNKARRPTSGATLVQFNQG